jgi:SagB-type dehydrogenase family enzyme
MVMTDGPASTLPPPRVSGTMSLEQALATRRSRRAYRPDRLDDTVVGQLLWAAQGITETATGHRSAPSAGALYALTVYWADERGLFRYEPQGHRLVAVRSGDVRPALTDVGLDQEAVRQAPAMLVIVGDPTRLSAKYGEMADDFAAIECGHAAQNVLLQAAAWHVAATPVGGLDRALARRVLGHPDSAHAYYLIPVGRPAN